MKKKETYPANFDPKRPLVDVIVGRPADAPAVAALLQEVWPAESPAAHLVTDVLSRPTHLLHLARLASRPAGFVSAFELNHPLLGFIWQVDLLGVAPAGRRQGLGRRLLAATLAAGQKRGAAAARALIAVDNAPSQAAFHAAGFTPDPQPHLLLSRLIGGSEPIPPPPPGRQPLAVHTLTYHGLWLEPTSHSPIPESRPAAPFLISLTLPATDRGLREELCVVGFEVAGQYRHWICVYD